MDDLIFINNLTFLQDSFLINNLWMRLLSVTLYLERLFSYF